ncbi:MAG: class I SAM-dependent methyltransferase [Burkholderiales bacterium]|nr:class I SAM-dependent methyltransferase [Burkholderiales bacterium]
MTRLKSAAKQLPVIDRLIAQRDDLAAQVAAGQQQHAALRQQLEAIREALAAFEQQLNQQAAARDVAAAAAHHAADSAAAELAALRQACGFVPPGHYYSPIPSLDEVRRDEARIFGPVPREIPGIALREPEQLALLAQLAAHYADMPFGEQATEGLRYHFDNPSYAYSDGILLHCMLRHLRPQRLVEIGSGFSSCVTLDTNERFLGGALQTTFIEPYPALLMSLLRPEDHARVTIHPQRLQDVDLAVFAQLQAGDVLFVDSTHVSRVGSDVNRLFFDILPALASGVVIHFHDIFHPFEYPKEWIYFGRAWNELYLLRAFLQYNSAFDVLLMNTFMAHFHREFFAERMPLCLKNTGGSIWLRKR